MRPGARLDSFSRLLLRDETYRLIAAPAIADLQAEHAQAGPWRRIVNRLAVWKTLGIALALDLRHDLAIVVTRVDGHSPYRVALVVYVISVVIATWAALPRGFGIDILGADGYAAMVGNRLTTVAIPNLPILLLPLAAIVGRRGWAGVRPVIVAMAIVSAVTVGAAETFAPRAYTVSDAYFKAAVWRGRVEPQNMHRPLSEFLDKGYRRSMTVTSAPRPPVPPSRMRWSRDAAIVVATLALALVGMAISRTRGWRIGLHLALIYVPWAAAVWAVGLTSLAWDSQRAPVAWIPVLLLILAAIVALLVPVGRHRVQTS
jgi:hypothetical protein